MEGKPEGLRDLVIIVDGTPVDSPSKGKDSEPALGEDPYLTIAKDVRDRLQSLVNDADNADGLACLINCDDYNDDALTHHLQRALKYVAQAARDMRAVVRKLETLADEAEDEDLSCEATCRICGCTDNAACPGGCYWVDDPEDEMADLCSQCLEKHYPEIAAKRIAAHPDCMFPLSETVEGEKPE